MSNQEQTRRQVLGTAGTIATIGLAGCLGAPGGGEESTPTATPTETKTPTPAEESGHHEEDEHHTEEGHEEDGGHGADGPAEHVEVEMLSNDTGHHFHPHVAWVEVGGTVTWTLDSGVHTTAAYHPDNGDRPQRIPDGADPWDSGTVAEEGATFEVTFDTEGVYDYYCAPHEATGMLGSVIVGEPDAHDQPGLAEPQSGLPDGAQSKLTELNEMVNKKLGHTH